jgi:hypothetical protein
MGSPEQDLKYEYGTRKQRKREMGAAHMHEHERERRTTGHEHS